MLTSLLLLVALPDAAAAPRRAAPNHPLSCAEILHMVQMGLPPGAIAGAVGRTPPGYSEGEVRCLQSKGAPAEVVAAVRARVPDQAAPAAPLALPVESGADTTSEPTAEPRGRRGGRRPERAASDAGAEKFRLGGDYQLNFVSEHMERNGDPAYAANPPRPTFTIAHLRPRADLDATPWLSLRAAMEFAAYPDSPPADPELVGDSLAVSDTDESVLDPTVDELYLRLHAGKQLRTALRVGAMHTAFGLRDSYDAYDAFYLGGQLAYMEPERRFGVSPGIDMGVGGRIAWKDMASLDLQLINGSGVTRLDSTAAKDVVARVTIAPVSFVEARASVMHAGTKDDGHTHGAFSLELNARELIPAVAPRVVAEAVMSRVSAGGYDTDRLAWLVAGAADLPLKTSVTDHLTLVGSLSGFDPDYVKGVTNGAFAFDQTWYVDTGLNLYWNTGEGASAGRGGVRPLTAFTGLTFERVIPQNSQVPISNSLTVHCGLSR